MNDNFQRAVVVVITILAFFVAHLNNEINELQVELNTAINLAEGAYNQAYQATDDAEEAYNLAEEASYQAEEVFGLVEDIDRRINY